jgi:hypothetical protein
MNGKLFKLVPCTAEEIKADPKQPFIVVWNLKPDGFIVSPNKIIAPDWARHIAEGSAAIHNTDNLIKTALKPELPKSPPNCPICQGERESNGNGGYICHFCGREMSV